MTQITAEEYHEAVAQATNEMAMRILWKDAHCFGEYVADDGTLTGETEIVVMEWVAQHVTTKDWFADSKYQAHHYCDIIRVASIGCVTNRDDWSSNLTPTERLKRCAQQSYENDLFDGTCDEVRRRIEGHNETTNEQMEIDTNGR